jgi:hypothetical protein
LERHDVGGQRRYVTRDGEFTLIEHPIHDKTMLLAPVDWRQVMALSRSDDWRFQHPGVQSAQSFLTRWYRSRREQPLRSGHEHGEATLGSVAQGSGESGAAGAREGASDRPLRAA